MYKLIIAAGRRRRVVFTSDFYLRSSGFEYRTSMASFQSKIRFEVIKLGFCVIVFVGIIIRILRLKILRIMYIKKEVNLTL